VDIFDIVKNKEYENVVQTTANNLNEKLKKKGSVPVLEEKLKKYISTIMDKDHKSAFEKNIIERFDEVLKE